MRLDVKNLNFGYTKKVQILHNINFSVESGQLVSLIGPNGSGKTTIIKCINQILSPQSGQIFLDGTNVHTMRTMELAKKVGYVPQMTKNFMGGTVLDAVLMGRRPYIKWKITDYDVTLVLEILKKLEITHLAHHKLVIMVVHDLTMALRYSDYIVLLEKGSVISQGVSHQVLNSENIFNVYGVNVNILEGNYVAPI